MSRVYAGHTLRLPPRCEHEGCDALATHAAEYTEDTSYHHYGRWIRSEIEDTAYFCDEHLPVEARRKQVSP